ncbi:cardiolipin synthase [Cupriavidus basilensis]|uniref:cardiolipin synthase n=1 Tax=Cupriavidus basilensis TaxID=68895 RepID=UPI0023E76264|nr:cardiolipin synthase [Cupriavidus basilensis]MDF3888013.1 cardiolipin synthase [Cupriavidus basilensis]
MTSLLLVGCGSLPRINPDMALSPPHPIQLEGAHGPISKQRSEAILAGLKSGGNTTNIFESHLALEQELGGSPLMVGNKVELLIDGPATYDSMFASISAGKDHINMETFILEADEIGQRFVDALLVKQQAGVQVNLIYDSVGSLSTPKQFLQPLVDAGVNVLEYNPVNPLNARKDWELNERDHRKLLVVDGRIAYVGGINISSVYSSGSSRRSFASSTAGKRAAHKTDGMAWRDTHLRMEGPVVAEFQKLFMATWEKQKGDALGGRDYYPQLSNVGGEVVRAVGSSPNDPYSLIYVALLSAINSSLSQVYITNAYFIPDAQLLAALKDAAARGVDVRLLLPGRSDSNLVFYASRSFYRELLNSGVKIYERQDALLHAKTAMIDGVWSTVGSTNLDWRSFLNNQEINAVVLGENFGVRMRAMFEQDLQSSKQITIENWNERSLILRLKEAGARLWVRLL